MSDPSETPWSNGPNAPQIPSLLYLAEKEYFTGIIIGAMSYGALTHTCASLLIAPVGLTLLGIVVALFLQCMATLLSPANPIEKGVRWALVAHTTALFLFLTIAFGIGFEYLSIEYINNREFPGDDEFPPGPIGYGDFLALKATVAIFNAMFPLSQWLADGLLVSPILSSVASVFKWAVHPVASLLYRLFHEPLGHGLPIPDVPRLCWYVLESSPCWW